jgi:hypothetical protein
MKTLILTAMLALTAVSGAVVTAYPAAPTGAATAAKLTNKTARPSGLGLGAVFIFWVQQMGRLHL